jgi:hypothetical protein
LPLSKKKNPHAEALGSLGGKARAQSLSDAEIAKIARKGGHARSKKLSSAERTRIALLAVRAREKKRATAKKIGEQWCESNRDRSSALGIAGMSATGSAANAGKPLSLGSVGDRHILPALNRCATCGKRELDHAKADHDYGRDETVPHWHGWHASRRGLGSNLYRLGVHDKVIQRILRHANVSTTTGYYIKSQAKDVLDAMTKLENSIPAPQISTSDTQRTLNLKSSESSTSIQ